MGWKPKLRGVGAGIRFGRSVLFLVIGGRAGGWAHLAALGSGDTLGAA